MMNDMSSPNGVHGAVHRVLAVPDHAMHAPAALLRRDATDWREQLSTMSCEVDYARGGGSSGAMVRDVGAERTNAPAPDAGFRFARFIRASAPMKPAAHDANS